MRAKLDITATSEGPGVERTGLESELQLQKIIVTGMESAGEGPRVDLQVGYGGGEGKIEVQHSQMFLLALLLKASESPLRRRLQENEV